MTPRQAFLAAIRANPDDDAPRLIFADWLEEHGGPDDAARAEFIRLGCELAAKFGRLGDERYTAIASRQNELIWSHAGAWTEGLPECLVTAKCPSCIDALPDWETNAIECRWCDGTGLIDDFGRLVFRRGFVDAVSIDWPAFRSHHAAILAHPVTAVAFTSWPELEYLTGPGGGRYTYDVRLRGLRRAGRILPTDGNDKAVRKLLRFEWPQVQTWTLPGDTATQREAEGVPG